MCEANRQLAQAPYELQLQRGNGVIDLGKLERLLTATDHEHQETT